MRKLTCGSITRIESIAEFFGQMVELLTNTIHFWNTMMTFQDSAKLALFSLFLLSVQQTKNHQKNSQKERLLLGFVTIQSLFGICLSAMNSVQQGITMEKPTVTVLLLSSVTIRLQFL